VARPFAFGVNGTPARRITAIKGLRCFMAPPQLAVSLVPVVGGVSFNVMAITANRFQIRKGNVVKAVLRNLHI
jgi:hypothetical protein